MARRDAVHFTPRDQLSEKGEPRTPGFLFNQNGNAIIRPRYVPTAVPWLARFVHACMPNQVEQISRALGISLRTVRRRVAEITDDLGADSRFQAGVEAVRRGWL